MINNRIRKVRELIWRIRIFSNFKIIKVLRMLLLSKNSRRKNIIINLNNNKFQIFIKEQILKLFKIN